MRAIVHRSTTGLALSIVLVGCLASAAGPRSLTAHADDKSNMPCVVWTHTPSDQDPSVPGQTDPQLGLVSGTLYSDGTTLKVILSVENMSSSVPTGWDEMDYFMFWKRDDQTSYYGHAYFDSLGHSYYADGVWSPGLYIYPGGTEVPLSSSQPIGGHSPRDNNIDDHGTFVTGSNGSIEIDVPLAHVGNPSKGTTISAIQGGTVTGRGTTNLGPGTAWYTVGDFVDQAGPDSDYVIGKGCGDQSHAVRASTERHRAVARTITSIRVTARLTLLNA